MARCINKELPADIRVVNVFKVSKSFDGRKHCDKRTYDYLLPARLLIPTDGAPRHFSKVIIVARTLPRYNAFARCFQFAHLAQLWVI